MNLDELLIDIQRRGRFNGMAIQTGKDIRSGMRGAFGRNERKNEMRGIACPKRQVASSAESAPLPSAKYLGKPLACSGPKPNGDGYKRDRITGIITRC